MPWDSRGESRGMDGMVGCMTACTGRTNKAMPAVLHRHRLGSGQELGGLDVHATIAAAQVPQAVGASSVHALEGLLVAVAALHDKLAWATSLNADAL